MNVKLGCDRWFLLGGLLVMLVTGAGCESLQRKFTRRTDKAVERPEPVFRFKDYAKERSAEEAYESAFEAYRLWIRELVFEVDQSGRNTRRVRQYSRKVLEALEQMLELLREEKSSEFSVLVDHWRGVDVQLQKKEIFPGEMSFLSRDANEQLREVHRNYRLVHVRQSLETADTSDYGTVRVE